MVTSIGSDGELSLSCDSPTTPPVSPTARSKAQLKFSIANILKPEFGSRSNEQSSALSPLASPTSTSDGQFSNETTKVTQPPVLWPAWVFCTRYSDRPSSGPRCRRLKRKATPVPEDKRPRTAFSSDQLNRLKKEFQENRYVTEKRRQELAHELALNESQIKIWFQNKRAKIKKQTGGFRNPLAFALMSQGLYNHATVPVLDDDSDKEMK